MYQAAVPYVIMDLIMVVYIHFRILTGLQSQDFSVRFLHTIKSLVVLLTVSGMFCSKEVYDLVLFLVFVFAFVVDNLVAH